MDHAIDYDIIAAELTRLAQERQYQLLETFAEEGAARLLELFDAVVSVEILIRKPAAVPAADCSFVHVFRERDAS